MCIKKIVNCLFTHEAHRSWYQLVLTCPCVTGRIGIWKCWFWGEGETGVPGEKPLGAKERTNNKLIVEVIIKKKIRKNHWHQYKARARRWLIQKLIKVVNSFCVYFFFWSATKLKYGGIPNIFDKTVQIPLVAHTTSWDGFSIRFTLEEFGTKLVS